MTRAISDCAGPRPADVQRLAYHLFEEVHSASTVRNALLALRAL
jgi:hypothetical protein